MSTPQLHLGVAIDGAGGHPAAWRWPSSAARPTDPDQLVALVQLAARGLLDLVTLDDRLALVSRREDRVRGALDALLGLARVAPVTAGVGLVPTVTTTHTEPFHVAKNVATLDWVSDGRAGWRPAVSRGDDEVAHFGRRPVEDDAALVAEAGEVVDVVRRLWDSWEDDAVIRDVATGRYLDRSKVHTVDFEGSRFSVRGPSITPRSPQGQPVVVVHADGPDALALAARWADVVLVDAPDPAAASSAAAALREAVAAAGRPPEEVRVLVQVEVLLAASDPAAVDRATALGRMAPWPTVAGRARFLGTPVDLAEVLLEWGDAPGVDGVHLLPGLLPDDLELVVTRTVPALQAAGRFRTAYEGRTLRDRLGLGRPANRYARTGEG